MLLVLRRKAAFYGETTLGTCMKGCRLEARLNLFLTGLDYESVLGIWLEAVIVVQSSDVRGVCVLTNEGVRQQMIWSERQRN